MRAEFELGILELRPCQRGACRKSVRIKPNSIAPTLCTSETLLGTKGLLVMLLHWATSFKSKAGRASAHAMLEDLLRQVLSAVDDDDEMWISLTCCRIAKKELGEPLCEDQISTTQERHACWQLPMPVPRPNGSQSNRCWEPGPSRKRQTRPNRCRRQLPQIYSECSGKQGWG